MDDVTRVEWHEWGGEAFELARETDRPVLLSLSATWCTDCHEMDAETYAEPRIAANVNDAFMPIRVDVDRHPRVRDQYNMGGFPSTVFLAPDGSLLTGAGYLGPDGMRQVIESVRQLWETKGAEAGRIPRPLREDEPPAGELTEDIEGRLLARLREAYDETAGGWGDGPKFPLPDALEFALKRDREMALRSFDAVGANLLDEHEGGFYRYASERNWSGIHHEKLLDENAALVRAFANAYLHTGREEYREPAARTIEYLTTTLWTDVAGSAGAFAGSQAPGSAENYTLDATDREAADDPPVDDTVYAGPNALAIDALLTYYGYTDDERARRFAERALETLRERLLEDGVVVHFREGEVGATEGSETSETRAGSEATREESEIGVSKANEISEQRTGSEATRKESEVGATEGSETSESRTATGGRRETGEDDATNESEIPRVEGERCLLRSQARVLRALTSAKSALGADVLADARAVADTAIDRLRDGDSFLDGPREGPGLLERPLRPLDANVELADALLDLAVLTGERRYRRVARETVADFAGASDRFGVQVTRYGTVVSRLLSGPLVVRVAAPAGSDLHRAAMRIADHEAVVVPAADATDLPDGSAQLEYGDRTSAPAETPEELNERVGSILE